MRGIMGNNIFITEADTFDVTIHYKPEGRRVKILAEAEKEMQDVSMPADVPADAKVEKREVVISQSVTITFKIPNFADSQQIIRSATSLDSNGQPVLNFMQLQSSLLYTLAQKWDAKDDKGLPVELNTHNLSKLRVEIAKAAVEQVNAELGESGLI